MNGREKDTWWGVFTTVELEKIKQRKARELRELVQNETDHSLAAMRGEHLAKDITNIDMELKGRE